MNGKRIEDLPEQEFRGMTKTVGDLGQEDFEQMLENMSTPEYDGLTEDEFFSILAAMDPTDSENQ